MIYRVDIQKRAHNDIRELVRWLAPHAPDTEHHWYETLVNEIDSLAKHPDRCPLIEEHRKINHEIRRLLFGKYPHRLRIIFIIERDEVRVLRVLRTQRGQLTRRQLQKMLGDDEEE